MDFFQIIKNIGDIMAKYWKVFLIEGVSNTLILTCIAVSLGAILGTLVAIMKMSHFAPLRFIVTAYVEIIRGTPILLQLYIFYFCLPQMLPFLKLSAFMWVAIAMCVNSSAYVSEVIRSGIQAVDKGQTEAARSLGLSAGQTMVKVVLPQAIKNILPAIANEFVTIIKESAICYTIGVQDIMSAVNAVKGATYRTGEALIIATVLYFCLTFPTSKIIAYFERRMSRGDRR